MADFKWEGNFMVFLTTTSAIFPDPERATCLRDSYFLLAAFIFGLERRRRRGRGTQKKVEKKKN